MPNCKNSYKLPLNISKITHWHKHSSAFHRGIFKHCLDFFAPEGTFIYAAASGKVVFVKQDSNIGGMYKKFINEGNRIVIKHKNNEHTAYEHLKHKSSLVRVGQRVKRGQSIALVGNTGWSSAPHLHFEVFRNPISYHEGGETLQISFRLPRIGRCKPSCYG